MEPVEQI